MNPLPAMANDPVPDQAPPDSWDRRVADVLHASKDVRAEALRLRYQSLELRHAILQSQADDGEGRKFQKAALNLLEDAEAARRATREENLERRRAEEALLRAARANAFRVTLGDALRSLTDPTGIQSTATHLLREHLGASRTAYGEVTPEGDEQIITCDHAGGLPPLPRRVRFSDYDPATVEGLREGRPVVVDDVRMDGSYAGHATLWHEAAIAAYISVPLRRDGILMATLNVVHSAPRNWLAEEIAMVEEVAGRTWDVLERARAQEALRTAEERQRIALEAAGMGAWDLDVPTGRLVWNAQHFRLFGLEPDGRSFTDEQFFRLVHPDDREKIVRWKEAVDRDESRAIEYRIVRPDGITRWMSGFGHAAARVDGQTTRLSGVTFDITERHAAAEMLAAAQERLRLVVESAQAHGIVSTDLQCRITSWNPGAENITGYLANEMIGQSLDLLFLPEDREKQVPAREMQEALTRGRAVGSHWHQRKDGGLFWTTCALMPMRTGAAGEVVGFVKVFSDETEMQQARHELEQNREDLYRALQEAESASAEAEAAGRAKDHFLAVLSHELRTPLMPVLMALGALSRRKDLPPAVKAAHEMIERNVELEARFIDDMLDVTRIVRGKLEIVCADMDLHEAARRAVEVSTPDLEAKSQRLTVALDAAEHRVQGDFARLQQAMWNLLKNASKFTPAGGEITIRSRNESGSAVIEVADSGIGMEAEVIAHIFNPFEQADSTIAREFGGLGLGLAIAKATVEAHGGQLRASSPGRDRGATFTLHLPLADGTAPPTERRNPNSHP